MPGPEQPIPPEKMLGASDWDDQDLLTAAEASERLADEVRLARERAVEAEQRLEAASGDEARELRRTVDAERVRAEELTEAAARIAAARPDAR